MLPLGVTRLDLFKDDDDEKRSAGGRCRQSQAIAIVMMALDAGRDDMLY